MSQTTQKLVRMGILTAISVLLMYLVRIPMFMPFLEYDPADIPILVGTLIYGPGAGLLLTVAVSLLQWLTVSQGSQIWGCIMHICATGAMVLAVSLVYYRFKLQLSREKHAGGGGTLTINYRKERRIFKAGDKAQQKPPQNKLAALLRKARESRSLVLAVSLVCGALAMAALMVPLNLIITPIYTGFPVSAVAELLVPAIIPFNLVKAGLNCAVTFVLFSAIGRFLMPKARL